MGSDQFQECAIDLLLEWILADAEKGSILGIPQELFYVPQAADPFPMHRYGQLLETPLGVAAGPHTQLAQNIIAAWLCGARYIELKTVQVLDELEVTKPCIDMADEGYNCEWSQELKLDQSFDQYLNAWILLHILKDKMGRGAPNEPGFIFNMSVGYNLEGIKSPAVQRFLDRMADCSADKSARIDALAGVYPRVRDLVIPDCISDNVTISTMHGCPPDEVEKIGRYFVAERKLHTTIKLNPTLLGPQRLRRILNEQLGFETVVPDLAFEHDLKYPEGVALIRNLLAEAEAGGTAFNIKLTNTLETRNLEQNLPDNGQMVYMSGRALHPISINLAARLQREFRGALDISFSAGVDCFNFPQVIACNLRPVTVCSDILKPGGYGRLSQYLGNLSGIISATGTNSLDTFIRAQGGEAPNVHQAGLANLTAYAAGVADRGAYKKAQFPYSTIKTSRELGIFDCIQAPCRETCPVAQNIPAYMHYTARGEYEKAYRVILADNPFPNVQGMVCDHLCQEKCTRINYDDPLLIREIKRFAARRHKGATGLKPGAPNGRKAAIVGAGPSGLACAHFLALAGFKVEIFEAKPFAGGWAADAIPAFRLDDASIRRDIQAILALGVKITYETRVDCERFAALRRDFDYVYIAIGAQAGTNLGIDGEDARGVWDQLEFLSAVRRGERPALGTKVAVIGGGNAAMDAARTAKRLVGGQGEVSVLYRRTRKEMPAAPEEIQALLDEGIQIVELTAPECMLVEDGRIRANLCFRMELGKKDDSGRRRPIKIDGSQFELEVDSVISAIGQQVCLDFFPEEQLTINPATHETQLPNVFAGGDAVRGAATLIKAIGDGKKVAHAICANAGVAPPPVPKLPGKDVDPATLGLRRARREIGARLPEISFDRRSGFDMVIKTMDSATARKEAARCLQCDEACNVCVTVCPNRANLGFVLEPVAFKVQQVQRQGEGAAVIDLGRGAIRQARQVLNIGDFCNECGNCTTFCPTSGAPYRDKAKFHLSPESFAAADFGFHFSAADRLEYKNGNQTAVLRITSAGYDYEDERVQAVLDTDFSTRQAFLKDDYQTAEMRPAAEMAILARAVGQIAPFGG